MALTEVAVRKAKPQTRPYTLGDGKGLWLHIYPNGSKLWRYRYKYLGKETMLSFGSYPEVTLVEAREKTTEARKLLQQKINPAAQRKHEKRLARFNSDNTFGAVAKDWFENNAKRWTPNHGKRLWRRLELHILPAIGKRPIGEVSTLELLEALRKPEKDDKTETAHRALQTCRSVFRYAVLTQKIKYNPALDLEGALKAHKTLNYPTIGHNQIPEFFERLTVAKTTELNRLAIKMLMLTFVRQGELRRAKWTDIDLTAQEWRIRPETTKMRTVHHVPLARQTVKILEATKKITGESEYIFASQQSRRNPFMSENTINKVLHGMGYKDLLVGHGFRSLASTILNENGFRADVIERQLAHMPRDQVRAAYNRAEYLPERRKMIQWWAEFLENLGLT